MNMRSTNVETKTQPAKKAREFNSIDEFLSANGINPTRQRVAIATHMFEKEQHLSADVILERVNSDAGSISVSKATVYNTLNLFVQEGILKEVVLDPQKILFDTNTQHHHHVLNTDNGEIRDIQPVDINLSEVEGIQQGIDVADVDLIIKVQNPKT